MKRKYNRKCICPACDKYAVYMLDGIPMCERCKEFYKNDFAKIVKIKQQKG